MTKTIELPEYYAPFGENARYGTLEELKELLLSWYVMKRKTNGLTKLNLFTTRTGLALWFDLGQCDSF